jgi:hypothetical protein
VQSQGHDLKALVNASRQGLGVTLVGFGDINGLGAICRFGCLNHSSDSFSQAIRACPAA